MPLSQPPPSWANIKNKPTTIAGFGITDNAAQAIAAQAGAAVGAVGTYALMRAPGAGITPGALIAGSGLNYGGMAFGTVSTSTNSRGSSRGSTPAGTWRAMGHADNIGVTDIDASSVFLRIS